MGHNIWAMRDSDEMTIGKTHPTLLNGMVIVQSKIVEFTVICQYR